MINGKSIGISDEWYTPPHVFKALGCEFDLDVAAPADLTHIRTPAKRFISADSLSVPWDGFVWMNPPFGGRNAIEPWLDKFFAHGNGGALTPDSTSAGWWQRQAWKAAAILFVSPRLKFVAPDGSVGKSPAMGTSLFAVGRQAVDAFQRAEDAQLGFVVKPWTGTRAP